jgi:hypothetical protein
MVKTFKQFINEIYDLNEESNPESPYKGVWFSPNAIDNRAAPVIFGKRRGFPSLLSVPSAVLGGLFASGVAKTAANLIAPEYSSAAQLAAATLGGVGAYRWWKRTTSGEDVDFMKGDYVRAVQRGDPKEKTDFLYGEYEKAVHKHNALVTPYVGKKIWTSYGKFETDDRRRLYPKNMMEYR